MAIPPGDRYAVLQTDFTRRNFETTIGSFFKSFYLPELKINTRNGNHEKALDTKGH